MKEEKYFLLDGRAHGQEFKESMIIMTGNLQECCDAANSGEFGKDCAVAYDDFEIAYEYFFTGKWAPH